MGPTCITGSAQSLSQCLQWGSLNLHKDHRAIFWGILSEEPGLRPQPPRGRPDSHAGTLPGREGRLRRWLSPKGGWTSGGFGPAGRLSGGLSGVSPPALVPVAEMWAQSSGQLGHSQALSPEVL